MPYERPGPAPLSSWLPCWLSVAGLLLGSLGPALAETPQNRVTAIREARASALAEPRPAEQRAPLGVGPGNRLFFMTGPDNAPCVRAMPDEVAAGTQDTNTNIVVHVLDGASDLPIIADGFEGGNTSAWSTTVPGS